MENTLALPIGTMLVGDYEIVRVLGAGGFGITYLARDITLDRAVAIKEYFPNDFAARSGADAVHFRSEAQEMDYKNGLERFVSEAQTLARFEHPNIVRVFRYFRANNTAYMVLQFEAGRSLKGWMDDLGRHPSQSELDAFLHPLLDALELLHAHDLLHRDIAPDNIIIRQNGAPVLIDFGSARGEMASVSKTVSAIVKPGYSPFEQYAARGHRQGPWTDIYALGATLYHAITGYRPLDAPTRLSGSEIAPARAVTHGDYRPGFLAAIDHALELKAEDRPATIRPWREALFGLPRAPRMGVRALASAAAAAKPSATPTSHDAAFPHLEPSGRMSPPGPQAATRVMGAAGPIAGAVPPGSEQATPGHAGLAPPPAATMKVETEAADAPRWKPRRLRTEFAADYASQPPPMDIPDTTLPSAAAARVHHEHTGPSVAAPLQTPRNRRASQLAAGTDANAGMAERVAGARRGLMDLLSNVMPTFRKTSTPDLTSPPGVEPVTSLSPSTPQPQEPAATPQTHAVDMPLTADIAARITAPGSSRAEQGPSLLTRAAGWVAQRMPENPRRWLLRSAFSAAWRLAAVTGIVYGLIMLPGALKRVEQRMAEAPVRVDPTPTTTRLGLAQTLRGHTGPVQALAVAQDNATIFSADADGNLRRWRSAQVVTASVTTPRVGAETTADVSSAPAVPPPPLALSRLPRPASSVAITGDSLFIGANDGSLRLMARSDARPVRDLSGHDGQVTGVAFAGSPRRLVSTSVDGRVRLWDARRGRYRTLDKHDGAVLSLAFANRADRFVTGGEDDTVRLWDHNRRRLLQTFHTHASDVLSVAITADARYIASGSTDRALKLWNPDDAGRIRTLTGHNAAITALAFSPDGRWLASGSADNTVKLWDVATGSLRYTFVGHTGVVRALAFLPHGRQLVSAGDDASVRIWDSFVVDPAS